MADELSVPVADLRQLLEAAKAQAEGIEDDRDWFDWTVAARTAYPALIECLLSIEHSMTVALIGDYDAMEHRIRSIREALDKLARRLGGKNA